MANVGRSPSRIRAARWVLTAGLAVWASWATAATPPEYEPKANTRRKAREEAVKAIPYDKLARDAQAKVSRVLKSTTLFRRLPNQMIECDPRLFLFLVDHPDLVVNLWQVLGVSDVTLNRGGENMFEANDGAGTNGRIEFLYRSANTHVVYAEGIYEGPLFGRPIRGRCLLVLHNRFLRETSGRQYVSCRLDTFLQMDAVGASVLTKTFQPLVGAAADHNFKETVAFVASVHRAAEVNQEGIQRMAERLQGVEPEDRERFAALTEELGVRAALAQPAPRRPNVPVGRPATTVRRASPRPTARR